MSQGTVKKVKLNFIFGILAQVITLGIGIIIPKLFISSFGSEVNGYINSINQIITYIALLEAGVGAASIQALYAPIGNNQKDKINGILAATNKFYTRTAVIYLGIVLGLSFVYPLLIKSTLSYPLMVIIFMITGGSGVVPYFCQAKYKIFLTVDGKGYVVTILTTLYQVVLSFGKALLLLAGFNVITVQSLYLILNIVQAIAFTIYIKKKYNWVNLKVKPDVQAISKSKSVIIHQISGLIFNNTDVLILTFFCDLKTVSVYALYKTFISIIGTLVNHFSNSISFRLGQLFDHRDRFLKLFDAYETFHIALTFGLCTIAYLFFMPFLTLYTEGMDANYLLTYMPLLVVVIEILTYSRIPSQNVINYAGHFKETQWRSLAESIINLGLSLIMVNIFGIYGVLIGTVVALLYRVNDIIIYSNKTILKRSPLPAYRTWLVNIAFSVGVALLVTRLNLPTDNYISLIISAGVVTVVTVPTQILVNFVINKKAGLFAIELAKKLLHK